jgi:hypothetical protein
MARWLLIAVLVLLGVLGVSQLLIPPAVEHRIESRLTDGGGSADVSVGAFPAVRLLFADGSHLSATGSGLRLGLEQQATVFDKLDGFDRVDVSLTGSRAGPFAVSSFELSRSSPSVPYHLLSRARTTPGELTAYGASRLGIPGASLLRLFSGQAPGGNQPIPVDLDMRLTSDGGRVVVVSGGGTIAGFPTGPLAELITSAIVVKL